MVAAATSASAARKLSPIGTSGVLSAARAAASAAALFVALVFVTSGDCGGGGGGGGGGAAGTDDRGPTGASASAGGPTPPDHRRPGRARGGVAARVAACWVRGAEDCSRLEPGVGTGPSAGGGGR